MREELREVGRGQVIMRMPPDVLGDAGVGHDEDRFGTHGGERAHMLRHFHGAGGASHADHIDVVGFQRHQRRPDLRAEQHGSHGLNGDRDDDGDAAFGGGKIREGAVQRRLGLQDVLAGLDAQEIGPAFHRTSSPVPRRSRPSHGR